MDSFFLRFRILDLYLQKYEVATKYLNSNQPYKSFTCSQKIIFIRIQQSFRKYHSEKS